MPRGVKGSGTSKPKKVQKTAAERIIDIDATMAELKEERKNLLKQVKQEEKELAAAKEQQAKEEVAKLIAETGVSADEIRALIEKNKK